MATQAETIQAAPERDYLNNEFGLGSWFFTTDHKRIALLYLFSITFMFFVGAFFALIIRLELLTPKGDLVQPDTYNKMFTQHGLVMIFFFLIPSIPAVLGNFLIPLMIGAKDVAFPKLNLLSWYVYDVGAIMFIYTILTGGLDTGWTFYTPLSTSFVSSSVVVGALAIFVVGFSSILTSINFIVTVHRLRAPGMTWGRLPLFVWASYATAVIIVLGTPLIAISMALVALEPLRQVVFRSRRFKRDLALDQRIDAVRRGERLFQ